MKRVLSRATRRAYAAEATKAEQQKQIAFKVTLDGIRFEVRARTNTKMSEAFAKHPDLINCAPIISPVLGHDAHVITPSRDKDVVLKELSDQDWDKVEELCLDPTKGVSMLASQIVIDESFEGKCFAIGGMNRIMRT
jgi:hypothetical protein